METIMHKIQRLYNDMGPSEKKIADYILGNSQEIIGLSVSELSNICGCGDATVVRFARRLGFDGYQGLKLSLAGEINSASTINREIEKNDGCLDIFRKRINDISVSLWNTESVLDEKVLERAANAIIPSVPSYGRYGRT